MLVNAVECKECEVTVYSRTTDDVRMCSCGRVVVMGGQGHFKYDTYTDPEHEVKKINVKANMEELYEDWLSMEDRFGYIEHVDKEPQEQKVYIF